MWSSPGSVRRPRVTTGGCSSSSTVSGIAPLATSTASELCSSQAFWYGTSPRLRTCARTSDLVRGFVPRLQLLAQVAQEAAGEGAVHEAVVVRERQVHDRADRDHVLAAVVLDHPWPLDDGVGAEDRGLRLADHRRAVERGVAARVRNSERAALDLVRRQLLVAGVLRDVGD